MDDGSGETAQAGRDNTVAMPRPFIVALLYLLNVMLGFSVFVGLVLAYIWRGEAQAQAWERTHYTYLIRTFWIGAALWALIFAVWLFMFFGITMSRLGQAGPPPAGFFLAFFGGMALFALSAIWFCIRAIMSMVKAGNREPMTNPESWLF